MANNSTTTSSLIMADAPGERRKAQYAPPVAPPASAERHRIALWGGLLLAVLLPVFGGLGLWQWDKWQDQMARQATLNAHGRSPIQAMPSQLFSAGELRDHRFRLDGEYDVAHQILIDNRVHNERAGYHVITPLRLTNSPTYVLVNRGWVPAPAEHSQIPMLAPPNGPVTISGIAVLPGERFFTLGAPPAAGWQTVWQNLDWSRFQRSVDYLLQPVVIQLDASAPGGYQRDWPRPDKHAERHLGYAVQWFGFAIASLGIWLYFLLRRP